MTLSKEQAHAIEGAVWLFGLAALFYTGRWWPGIMFVIGVSAVVEGLTQGRGWYAFQGGVWSIAIGVWALFHFQIAVLFVAIGASMIVGALIRPPAFAKPKPIADHSMD